MGSKSKRRARVRLIAVPLALALGCATSIDTTRVEPRIEIEQLPASEFLVTRGEAVSVAYQPSVENVTGESIKLRRLELRTSARSPYEFENAKPLEFDVAIEPGAIESLTFDTWVVPHEPQAGNMVYLKGTAYFEIASGSFGVEFSSTFREQE